MEKTLHTTVLLNEAIDALALTETSVVVDATGGAGGHSLRILEVLKKGGTLIVLDADPKNIEELQKRVGGHDAHIHYVCGNFREIAKHVATLGITQVDAVLADLGWSSDQFELGGKGFSFQKNEPLIMTYGDPATYSFTARDIVNDWREESIADVLYAYADEHFSRRIAEKICEVRKVRPIETTDELVAVVKDAIPKRFQSRRINPATKTFQALRIAVNDELDALKDMIEGSYAILKPQGRIAVITFHSIEDRIVKNIFKEKGVLGEGNVLTKKPLIASEEELKVNPRARSAKLRILEKI